jgi:hypothetical protein
LTARSLCLSIPSKRRINTRNCVAYSKEVPLE